MCADALPPWQSWALATIATSRRTEATKVKLKTDKLFLPAGYPAAVASPLEEMISDVASLST